MQRKLALAVATSLSLLLLASPAGAQRDWQSSELGPNRDGFTMGASFGRGSIEVDCGTCGEAKLTEALSISAHAGYMITSRLALLGEHWSVRYNARGGPLFDDTERHLVAQHISMVAAQLFVTNSVWVKAGLGVGWHITDGDYAKDLPDPAPMTIAAAQGQGPQPGPEEDRGTGAASFAAIGWEVAHNSVFAADIQLRIAATKRPDERFQVYNTGLNIGFNWY